ncbi:MAG: cytochrome c [Acidobacteria bacterium]|nr:cytochrome c [Acidobacteriota bacterium]
MRRNALALLAMGSTLVMAGCRQDMHNQPRMFPQRPTTLFADGRSVRPQVTGTVAREQGDATSYFITGNINGKVGDGLPMPVTMELLERGQERFNIYCTACHSRVGNGGGVIVQHGYRPAGDFQTERLRSMPLGHFYQVMTNGYGAMPDYAAQVTPEDRWAIAAYIRALQLSQHATQADVKPGEKLEKLGDIAEREGLPRDFAADWELPATAVYGTPDNQDEGIPGQRIVLGGAKGTSGSSPVNAKPGAVSEQKPAATPAASPVPQTSGHNR